MAEALKIAGALTLACAWLWYAYIMVRIAGGKTRYYVTACIFLTMAVYTVYLTASSI